MPETVSNSEILWLLLNISTIVFCIVALVSTYQDRKVILLDDPNWWRKMEIVNWCFSRHCMTMAIAFILLIVSINAMFMPQLVEWSPTIIILTSIPVILNVKIINDLWRKAKLLNS